MTGNGGFQSPLQTFDTKPGWLAYSTFEFGFTEVTATRFKLSFKSIATNGTVLDEFMLTKSMTWAPNPTKAAARYTKTVTVPTPPTTDTAKIYAGLSVSFVTTAMSDDTWVAKYLQPGSRLFQLTTALPGNQTVWTVQDVWQAAYPVISLVAENPPWWLPSANLAGVQYLYNLIKPGGRLYFGP